MDMSLHRACKRLGIRGSTVVEYRDRGMSDYVAERLALKAGLHPYEVWPEMADARVQELERSCEECGASFVPTRAGHRYCSTRCGQRVWNRAYQRRRYWSDPEYRARRIEKRREDKRTMSPAVRRVENARSARWARENRERHNASNRAWYEANRDTINARRRARYAERRAS
jgi:ribosomal protein S27AE